MVDWLRFGADMEDLATQTLRTGKQVTGLLGPTVIQPYRGFVENGIANVRARIMEQPVFDSEPGGLRIDATLAANLLRWIVLLVSGGLVVLIGPSRIFLGAHWLSDVVAGYLLSFVLLGFAIEFHLRYLGPVVVKKKAKGTPPPDRVEP